MTLSYGSLFSGCGGADLGIDAAGLSLAFQCEIDRTASEVLRHRWPNVPKFADVRTCGKKNLPKVDVLVGGFPCQGLSVAGNRGGLADERSGLFYELARIARELRPRFLVWENVPGLLSSDDGRDFGRVLRHLGDSGFHGCWRVLDAQNFGVPQQRRRVFGVFARGRFGAERCAEILALADGVRGHSQKSREAGTVVAALTANGVGTCGADDSQAQAGNLGIFGGGDTGGERGVAATLTAKNQRLDFDSENFVLAFDCKKAGDGGSGINGTLRSMHGGGGGHAAVCMPIDMRQASRGETMTNNRKEGSSGGAPGTGIGEAGEPSPTLGLSHPPAVFRATDYRTGAFAETETSGSLTNSSDPSRSAPIVMQCHGSNVGPMGTLRAGSGTPFMFQERGREGGRSVEVRDDNLANALTAPNGGGRSQERNICADGTLRRLTPRECERLMGWPDDHTRYGDGGREIADGPRYRLIGNGIVSHVAEWLGRRILRYGNDA